MNIFVATSEFAPLAKAGGLADVAAALAAFLHRAGHDVRVLMPDYATLNRQAGTSITIGDHRPHIDD